MNELVSNTKNQNVFLTELSEIEGRLDPYFYKKEFRVLRHKLYDSGFVKLGSIIRDWNRGDGPRTGYYASENDDSVYFLRVNNLKNNTISLKNVKHLHRKIHNTKLKRTQVTSGDLIFAISGTKKNLGTVSIIPDNIKEANLNSALVRLNIDESKVTKRFFCLLFELDFIRTQIEFIGQGAAQNNLNNQEISSIQIPNISVSEQNKLVDLYNNSFKAKQQKEKEAKVLLASIDDYLLGALGIVLPKKDNSIQNRIFTSLLSNVSSNRFDCDYYKTYYKELIESVENSSFSTNSLEDVCYLVLNGKTPAKSDYSEKPTEYPIIKVGSYTNDHIDLKKVDYSHSSNSITAEKGDIFILSAAHQAEYVGRHIKYLNIEPKLPTSFVGELICVRANESKCNSMYLFSLLNTELYKSLLNREKTGQTSHIYGKDIKKIKIPVPSPEKQLEIAKYISEIHIKSKTLLEEASHSIQEAKLKVEKIILGE